MAESKYFKEKKKVGRWFEGEVEKLLIKRGCEVIDSEKLKYRQKKGWDREVRIKGEACKLEIKFDEMSELTGNVCVEDSALNQSISPIWVYGLPDGDHIDVYSMYLSDLKRFADRYPRRVVGEWKTSAALIPKYLFTSQPFINKFATIEKETSGRRASQSQAA